MFVSCYIRVTLKSLTTLIIIYIIIYRLNTNKHEFTGFRPNLYDIIVRILCGREINVDKVGYKLAEHINNFV